MSIERAPRGVGPILLAGRLADAVVAAIRDQNASVVVIERGSYVRVMAPERCCVTRRAIEHRLGEPFRLPVDLESVMSSFKGLLRITENEASWRLETEERRP